LDLTEYTILVYTRGMALKVYKCTRCGYQWASHRDKAPGTCANQKCRSPYWARPRRKGVKDGKKD